MATKLNLEILRSYGFKERTYKPDWDDTCIEFELPNGFSLSTMTQCNNQPTESDSLEGLSGWIYIETKEEFDDLLKKTYEEKIKEIAAINSDFDIDEYL